MRVEPSWAKSRRTIAIIPLSGESNGPLCYRVLTTSGGDATVTMMLVVGGGESSAMKGEQEHPRVIVQLIMQLIRQAVFRYEAC